MLNPKTLLNINVSPAAPLYPVIIIIIIFCEGGGFRLYLVG